MSLNSLFWSRARGWIFGTFIVLITLLVFRAYLLPNTFPSGFDLWRDVETYHFGLHGRWNAACLICLSAVGIWFTYFPVVSRDSNRFGLWLTTGAWLGVTVLTIVLSPASEQQFVGRESTFLLGYVSGLATARLFRRLDFYITALIVCGTVQSVIAIVYQSKGINVTIQPICSEV